MRGERKGRVISLCPIIISSLIPRGKEKKAQDLNEGGGKEESLQC